MFIYSLRASTLKFFAVIGVALATLVALIAFVPAYGQENTAVGAEREIKYDGVKNNDDRVEFLAQFGWSVENEPIESAEVTIPETFDKIFLQYNEIQKRQGLDLSKYKKRNVMRYTYKITNYEGFDGTVYANILVYRNRVIGGDVCSADIKGFLHGLEK